MQGWKINKTDLREILILVSGGVLGGLILYWWRGAQTGPVIGAVTGFAQAMYRRQKRKQGFRSSNKRA